MNVAILKSRAQAGIDAPPVTIEVFLSGGLPTLSIVGLAETAVRESKDRVRAALRSSGFDWPQEKIVVNLGPADMKKSGGRYDLPIAIGILVASRAIEADKAAGYEYYGELALNGELRFVPGILPAALCATEEGVPIIVPHANSGDALLAGGAVFAARTLAEVVGHLRDAPLAPATNSQAQNTAAVVPDLADVRGQQQARRALEIAAAGGHNILFKGPPGTGKSMLARRLPGILPAPDRQECIETAAIDSVLGKPIDLARWRQRPFRAPHHSASAAALVGGGSPPRPGEISRAHNGVLFLDELPEFNRTALEVLREPLETGAVTISRAGGHAEFPADFQLVAAMNPCPCGFLGDPVADCNCSEDRVAAYRSKISGPLLDRIDLQVAVTRPPGALLRPDAPKSEASSVVMSRVIEAREKQLVRSGICNAKLDGIELQQACNASRETWSLLESAMEAFALSARAHQRIWRVARTIADLAASAPVLPKHMAEAIQLRVPARQEGGGPYRVGRITASLPRP